MTQYFQMDFRNGLLLTQMELSKRYLIVVIIFMRINRRIFARLFGNSLIVYEAEKMIIGILVVLSRNVKITTDVLCKHLVYGLLRYR